MTILGSAQGPASRWLRGMASVGALAFAFATAAQAETLSLGSMTLYKNKGQPTYAEITLAGTASGDAARLRARVASPEAYRAAGLRYAPALGQIAVSARQGGDGRVGLRLDIPDAAADGSLDLLLLVGDAVSVAMAEYRLDFTGAARVFPALEAGTALIPTSPTAAATKGASTTSTIATTAKIAASSAAATIAGRPASAVVAASSAPPKLAAAKPASSPSAPIATARAAASGAVASALQSPAKSPSTSTSASTSASPSTSAASTDNVAAGQAAAALGAWADAWSRRDVDAYIGMYVPDFTGRTKPPSHTTWVADRRARIESKHGIEVRVSALSVISRSNLMVLTFTQSYAGDGLKQVSHKRLTMRREGERWLIQEETELP